MTGANLTVQPRLTLVLLAVSVALGSTGCATTARATTATASLPEPLANPVAESAPAPERAPAPAPARAERPRSGVKRPAPRSPPETRTPVLARTSGMARTVELKRPSPQEIEPVPFEPSVMTRPHRVSGREPQLTPEARAERVRGTALVRCVVTREGRVNHCRMLNQLPHMEQELLEALATWRVTPITRQGQALDAEYTFAVRLSPD